MCAALARSSENTVFHLGERLAGVDLVPRSNLHPAPATGWFVRFRFESPADLLRHVKLADGFFIPSRTPPSDAGGSVIVELALPGVEHPALLHGVVREATGGGLWIEAPWSRASLRWPPEFTRRMERRFGSDLFVEVGHPGAEPWICRAVDLSARGLRVSARSPELGVAGDLVDVTLLSPDRELALDEKSSGLRHRSSGKAISSSIRARIAWASGRSAGLELLDDAPALASVLDELRTRWAAVPEIVHDAGCLCADPLRRAG
jgi:hypothetical protein